MRLSLNVVFGLLFLELMLFAPSWAQMTNAAATAPSANADQHEKWMLITIEGKPSGYSFSETTPQVRDGKTQYVTHAKELVILQRLAYHLRSGSDAEIVEDGDGKILSFTTRGIDDPADAPPYYTGHRQGDDLVVKMDEGTDPATTETIPKVTALGPEAVRRAERQMPLQVGQSLALTVFDPTNPQEPRQIIEKVEAQEDRMVKGATIKAWKISIHNDKEADRAPIEWWDADHEIIGQSESIAGTNEMLMSPSTKEICAQPMDGFELLEQSVIRPDKKLTIPRNYSRVVYRFTLDNSTNSVPIWRNDPNQQHILQEQPGMAEVEVLAPRPNQLSQTAPALPQTPTPETSPYLSPSPMLESDSPDIQALSRQAVGGETNSVIASQRIEKFVRYYITKKDYRLGFVSALHVAHLREGDCKQHAVLCAALGRAAGLPTRVVEGLVYQPPNEELSAELRGEVNNGIFFYHMWAEAYVDHDHWLPMDAAVYGFDVGHIALNKMSLDATEEGKKEDVDVINNMIGHLKIEILSMELKRDDASDVVTPTNSAPSSDAPKPVNGVD